MSNPFSRPLHGPPPPPSAPHAGAPTEWTGRRGPQWRPDRLPDADPCILTTMHNGGPVMGTAILDTKMPVELPLPLELVPPEEVLTGPLMLQNGGYFVFADDYVDKYPQSDVANMVRAYHRRKSCEDSDDGGLTPSANNSMATTANSDASMNTSQTTHTSTGTVSAFRAKTEEVRAVMREVWDTSRPLFRRRNTSAVYSRACYAKRKFHETMDSEYPIEYFI